MTNQEALNEMNNLLDQNMSRIEAAKKLSKETGLDYEYLYWLTYNQIAKMNPETPALKADPYSEKFLGKSK